MAKTNLKTHTQAIVISGYTQITKFGDITGVFGVRAAGADCLLSIGHDVPTDATSITVPSGWYWEFIGGLTGPIFLKSLGSNQTVDLYGI